MHASECAEGTRFHVERAKLDFDTYSIKLAPLAPSLFPISSYPTSPSSSSTTRCHALGTNSHSDSLAQPSSSKSTIETYDFLTYGYRYQKGKHNDG
jgi:hypothetical protein